MPPAAAAVVAVSARTGDGVDASPADAPAEKAAAPPPRPAGYATASLWSLATFSYVNPLMRESAGAAKANTSLEQSAVDGLCPASDTAEVLAADFQRAYLRTEVTARTLLLRR